jgi:hypothetical protein
MISKRPALQTQEGSGVTVYRHMPLAGFRNYDPFVLWDDFNITPGHGFPDHPHRGFEAITYLFSGSIKHTDNLGNSSTVFAGGAQRFTAGRGLVHSEMPNESGATRGIQLWINLPKRLKQVEPGYQQVNDGEFPITEIEGGTVKTIVGPGSPLQLLTPVRYAHIHLNADASHSEAIAANLRGLVYVVEGSITIEGKNYTKGDAAFIEDEGAVSIQAREQSQLMLCLGTPHGEPIIQYGPFVD